MIEGWKLITFYMTEVSIIYLLPLICSVNRWTGFCVIGISVVKELIRFLVYIYSSCPFLYRRLSCDLLIQLIFIEANYRLCMKYSTGFLGDFRTCSLSTDSGWARKVGVDQTISLSVSKFRL